MRFRPSLHTSWGLMWGAGPVALAAFGALSAACSSSSPGPNGSMSGAAGATPVTSGASAGAVTSGAAGGSSGTASGSASTGASGAGTGASGVTSGASSGSSHPASAAFPLVTPPVRAAAPAGFGGAASAPSAMPFLGAPTLYASPPDDAGGAGGAGGLDANDIKSRFFGAGPTNIYSILGAIDGRISGLNAAIQTNAPACLSQTPVAYTIAPLGNEVTFYAQCYQSVGPATADDPNFIQFGQKDGVTYYYAAVGAAWTAAVLTPFGGAPTAEGDAGDPSESEDAANDASAANDANAVNAMNDATAGPGAGTYVVHAWSGVGYLNATGCGNMNGYDDCSYGVIALEADPSQATFEMSVAGIGFGYCGAQLKSDGTVVYAIGSIDMASICDAPETVCVAASDVTTPATCGAAAMSFSLPALGRVSSRGPNAGGPGVDAGPNGAWAPSQYPGGDLNSITLDGTSSDSLHFGPTSPASNVGSFTSP